MRGKGLLQVFIPEPFRITPACAGKSHLQKYPQFPVRDHPRVCGEKARTQRPTTLAQGSPPRMRGKAFCGAALWLPIRITPAYAGKRVAVESRSACVQDHPRVCGEKHCPRKKRLSWTESPPRMRGKGSSSFMAFTCAGITPAYAGKSRF